MVKTKNSYRSFLDINRCDYGDLCRILDFAAKIKVDRLCYSSALSGLQVCILLMKSSTRTRVSFEVGISRLGGSSVILHSRDMQLSRGESISDTAKVLGRYVDMIAIRCFEHSFLEIFDQYSGIPVINALSNESHPCQIMADILTYQENRGSISGAHVCWMGNCQNNVLNSWVHASRILDFKLVICSPDDPSLFIRDIRSLNNVSWEMDISKAVCCADLILTDSWLSMGDDESKIDEIKEKMTPYRVDSTVMSMAGSDVMFMHCLPAHRGEEVTDEVMDSSLSYVFEQAENRLHVQQAIMLWCMCKV